MHESDTRAIWKSIEDAHGTLRHWSDVSRQSPNQGIVAYIPGDEQIVIIVAESTEILRQQLSEEQSLLHQGWYAIGDLKALIAESPLLTQPRSALKAGRPMVLSSQEQIRRAPTGSGIYRIHISSPQGPEQIYIGQAVSLRRRLSSHEKVREFGWGRPNGITHIEILSAKDHPSMPWTLIDLDAAEEQHILRARERERAGGPRVINSTRGRNGRKASEVPRGRYAFLFPQDSFEGEGDERPSPERTKTQVRVRARASRRRTDPASGTALFWFRRDLRTFDNPALAAAGPNAVRVFVRDPYMAGVGTARTRYLDEALAELDVLQVAGDPAEELITLAKAQGTDAVYMTGDTTPYATRRDEAVRTALAQHGVRLVAVDTPYAIPPGEVRNPAGAGFRVFTPFYKAWLARGWAAPESTPEPTPAVLRWRRFRDENLAAYKANRDFPGLDATSRLSPALHFGQIHPRTILAEIDDPHTDPFARQLAWREFCADVLYHRPEAAWASLDERFDTHMEYSDDREHLRAWQQGRTGYPFVDAGMRQLLAEGWMHNRVRMVTASFLIKDLHLPWQWGARWFMQHLLDADVANNQLGWQWVAGCGTDAAPYFRIFNPVTQGRKFDPEGTYIRRYVPELRDVPDPHEPGILATDYPAPIVDHARERDVALARFHSLPVARGRLQARPEIGRNPRPSSRWEK